MAFDPRTVGLQQAQVLMVRTSAEEVSSPHEVTFSLPPVYRSLQLAAACGKAESTEAAISN